MIFLGFILFVLIILAFYIGFVLFSCLYEIFDDNIYRDASKKVEYTFKNLIKELISSPETHLTRGLVAFLLTFLSLLLLSLFYALIISIML